MDEQLVIYYALAFARLMGFFALIPLFSSESIQPMVRAVILMGFTPFIIHIPHPDTYFAMNGMLLAIVVKEALIGLFLGFLVSLPLRVPELIGEIIDNQRGAAVTAQYNPTMSGEASILGQFLSLAIITYFYLDGGLHQLITIVIQSFVIQPLGSTGFNFGESVWAVVEPMFVSYMTLFAILSLPVMIAMFVAEISLGVSSRFAQSINVFALAQPIKSLVAILFLIALYPRILHSIQLFFQKTVEVLHV